MEREKVKAVVDLFAGPGGLAEGFEQAGFRILASVEADVWAAETLRTRRLFRYLSVAGQIETYWQYVRGERSRADLLKSMPETVADGVIHAYISDDTRADILSRIEGMLKKGGYQAVDGMVGGPPCELYSLIGRARYRCMPEKYACDPRLRLFEHYLFFLERLKPRFFVFENVQGILSARLDQQSVLEILMESFARVGYILAEPPDGTVKGYILNSLHYGVPQTRRRLILIGFREDAVFRQPALREIYQHLPRQTQNPITVHDAIADLPALRPGEGNDRYAGAYPSTSGVSAYAIRLRKDSQGVLNHRARTHMDSDLQRYRFFIEMAQRGEKADLETLARLRPDLMPAHRNRSGFLDRFRVQWWDRPSSTITSHLSRDGHAYIHPDIRQLRTITVREAARLQSFPDNYFFEGPRTAQFRQVGNAVPPLMAHEIARAIMQVLYGGGEAD